MVPRQGHRVYSQKGILVKKKQTASDEKRRFDPAVSHYQISWRGTPDQIIISTEGIGGSNGRRAHPCLKDRLARPKATSLGEKLTGKREKMGISPLKRYTQ